ncbi:hypothetical protein SSBR45G_01410 [Bradyrhizobium sp. SSBR45G]|uniref:DUF1236 domain-containing protein n=1 Tax=unclassified Bradyrhizobium TaxID=2631580 RepID=UPI002342AE9A|nr:MULTISPECIES: DUF1236 domain-containing protein [unclassified Bradyrhizobium]GLH75233.1 hypothetical protein SSBR45G_01410 [Bradyrhizobium sp. SSBR45G]GLH82980.1 hypothetical protein SSBR45R_04400 [Bradyrhizobium sp. SSBR45R]
MTNRLMASVAAIALLASAGLANAQGAGGAGGAGQSGGAAMQGGATGAAPMNRDSAAPAPGGAPETRSSQSDQKPGMAPKAQRAEDGMKGPNAKGAASENDKAGSKNMKAEGRDSKSGTGAAENRDGHSDVNKNAETKTGNDRSQTTTGQAGAGAKLSTEQRTKISTVIRSQRVEPVTNVNFNISVGTRVPRDVRFYPLPTEVVTIYPEWRGYDYILVREQIIVLDPRTHEIVAVLDT